MSDSDSDFEFDFVHSERMKKRVHPQETSKVDEREKKKMKKSCSRILKSYKDLTSVERDQVDFVMKAKEFISVREGVSRSVWEGRYSGEVRTTIKNLFHECRTNSELDKEIGKLEDKLGVFPENGLNSFVRGVVGALVILRNRGEDISEVEKVANCVFNPWNKKATPTVFELYGAVDVIIHAFRYKITKKKKSDNAEKIDNVVLECFLGM